jgi:mono/diheme cytochrome c family protein
LSAIGRRMHWFLRSRLAVVLVFGVLLLALDVGRSIWARVGLAHPGAEYRPDPATYADLAWPPGADLHGEAPLRERVFALHCAVCHGPNGRGNGPAAPSMFPRPRDFSSGRFKYKSTTAGEPPTDQDLLRTIRDGLQGSAMPYFAGLLSPEELNAVVEQVKSFSSAFSRPGRSLDIPAAIPGSPESVARGKSLYASQGCAACHGDDVAAASVTMTAPATPCTRAISLRRGLSVAAAGPRTSGCA